MVLVGAAAGGLLLLRATDCKLPPAHVDCADCHLGSPRRALDDPRVAHVNGRVMHEGRPVGGVPVNALAHLDGFGAADYTTSDPDGWFSVAIRDGDLNDSRAFVLQALPPAIEGEGIAVVTVGPGETRSGVTIEVGAGVELRGRVTNRRGAAPPETRYGRVWVCFGGECIETQPDGSFAMTAYEAGRHRFQVTDRGHPSFGATDMPLVGAAPELELRTLRGFVGPIDLQIDDGAR